MSRVCRTRDELKHYIQLQTQHGHNPWLTITEVATITQFHRRTLQRYVDENIIPHERRGPKQRVFLPWSVVKKEFPQDTRDI